MLLHLTHISNEPLYLQVSRQIRAQILSGELQPGDSLPSIRVLAREQRVSVITVQTAYDYPQREGLIVSHRGKGFFVAELTSQQKARIAADRLREILDPLITSALAEGLEKKEIITIITNLVQDKP